MSRNLAYTVCAVCDAPVMLDGTPAKYVDGILGADATCVACGAKYFAWIGSPHGYEGFRDLGRMGFHDLSFRESFNDEPGPGDVPNKDVKTWKVVEVDGAEVYRERVWP